MDQTLNPARLENETFQEYKERRRKANAAVRQYCRGNKVWPSKTLGTYDKKKIEAIAEQNMNA